MEENQTQSQNSFEGTYEPDVSDNSAVLENDNSHQPDFEGQSEIKASDPSENLILGKFKSVEELSKAYEELQRHQGLCSEELGDLRKNALAIKQAKDNMELLQKYQRGFEKRILEDKEKYNAPEYFQDPSFREMYSEVFKVFGEDLDTDRFVNLLEGYVASRILANEKKKAAQNETDKVLNSMDYSKNSKTSFTPPKKRFDEMTQKEIDDLLERLI